MTEYSRVMGVDQLPSDRGASVEVCGRTVALFLREGRVYALDDMCPHSGGPLSESEVDGGCVVCPWHGARFELDTGRSVGEFVCRDARSYPARIVDGMVEVLLPAARGSVEKS